MNRSGATDTVSGDGRVQTPLRLQPPKRRVQFRQLLVATLLVVVSALTAGVVFSQATARTGVVALAVPVQRGKTLQAADLRVVLIAADDPIASIPEEEMADLVGGLAVADLEAGTILTPAYVTSLGVLAPGEGVVGLALAPGEYPTPDLAPGDLVDVVSTVASGEDPVVASGAQVSNVAELGSGGERFVSLRMPANDAAQVARLEAAEGVRLVLVAGGAR
jgi:hypothetical protein